MLVGRSAVLSLVAVVVLFAAAPSASAVVACPNANPVIDENQCHTGTSGWRVDSYSPNLGGFPTQTSTDLGQDVTLKIARNAPTFPATSATIAVYRMGYYGGLAARLVHSATGVTINNDFSQPNFGCNPMDPTTGEVDCGNWSPTYTIPGSALPASGIYLAKVTASTGEQTHIVFTVRDDRRQPQADMLFVLPTADYTAYNTFGGKSLYWGSVGGNTVSGTSRAVKVSFNRPLSTVGREKDWLFGPDYNTLYWLEQQGYDVSYSEDVDVHRNPLKLLQHNVVVIPGHSEYWSAEEYNGVKAARDAGVNVASFSANTSYWKVRYEDGERTLVCYKTVEGGGSAGSGAISANDWGPDGLQGTADDALGADGKAGTADDNPQNSTTTWRDNGAPPGDTNAPPGGRVGPNMPENSLWGVMYFGDNDSFNYPLTVPGGEFAADRVWRNTGITGTTNLGTEIVGWEWDAVPTQAQYLAFQPAGVKRLSASNVQARSDNSWLQDEGRARTTNPPPGQPGTVNAVKYTAPSGALVFSGGTNQWALGFLEDPDPRIQQASYNIFSDMGIQPATPAGIVTDPPGSANRAPVASFTIAPNPAGTNQTMTFDGGGSTDAGGSVARYEWDLDGNGSFETNSSGNPVASTTYGAEGVYTVRLRVTDNGGATDRQAKTVTISGIGGPPGGGGGGEQPGGSPPGGGAGQLPAGPAAVSLAALRKSLRSEAARGVTALKRLGLPAVRRKGLTLKGFHALTAGKAVARLVAAPAAKESRRSAKQIVVASGAKRFAKAGTGSIRLAVTTAGRKLLRGRTKVKLTLRLSFTDAAGRKVSSSRAARLG